MSTATRGSRVARGMENTKSHGNAGFDSSPAPPLIETLLTVDIEQAVHLAQRMRNLEAVCRSYSGTLGDEVESIRAQMARMFGL